MWQGMTLLLACVMGKGQAMGWQSLGGLQAGEEKEGQYCTRSTRAGGIAQA